MQPTIGPSISCACVQCEQGSLFLSVWSVVVDPHPLPPVPPTQPSLFLLTPLFMLGNDHQNTIKSQIYLHATLSCGITTKHDMSRIHKQERSCPVMCVWLSVGCCKQVEEMWMWLTLPDWLSALAPGYEHEFLVIYRHGVVSHKASGWGRERESAEQQYLIQVWQIFCRKSIQTAPSNISDPLVLPQL